MTDFLDVIHHLDLTETPRFGGWSQSPLACKTYYVAYQQIQLVPISR
jgi:hypothetical protein